MKKLKKINVMGSIQFTYKKFESISEPGQF